MLYSLLHQIYQDRREVIEGMELVRRIEEQGDAGIKGKPLKVVKISECGEVGKEGGGLSTLK